MTQAIAQNKPWDDSEPDVSLPPTDLWSDEPPLESDLHREQIDLLIRLLKWWWRKRDDVYVAGNLTVYYNERQLTSRDFRGPDFFVVTGTEKRDRRSWIVWAEDGKYPHLIVELLSRSTATVDRGLKKQLYQDVFRTPNYVWFDPETLEFKGFHLADGEYHELTPNDQGWLWIQAVELYLGIHERKLRFFTPEGTLVPLPEEEERQRAEVAAAEVERLREELRLLRNSNEE